MRTNVATNSHFASYVDRWKHEKASAPKPQEESVPVLDPPLLGVRNSSFSSSTRNSQHFFSLGLLDGRTSSKTSIMESSFEPTTTMPPAENEGGMPHLVLLHLDEAGGSNIQATPTPSSMGPTTRTPPSRTTTTTTSTSFLPAATAEELRDLSSFYYRLALPPPRHEGVVVAAPLGPTITYDGGFNDQGGADKKKMDGVLGGGGGAGNKTPPKYSGCGGGNPGGKKRFFTGGEPPEESSSAMTSNNRGGGTATAASTQNLKNDEPHRHVGGVTDAAINAFHEAMDLIDPVEKLGWTRAQASCRPSVLVHECCPCYFMKACRGNPWKAAARMCKYWTERIHLFEESHAFEALTLGSDVASPTGLTEDDVRLLETGALSLLPCNREGRSVIFCDYARLELDMVKQMKSRLRVYWYVLQAAYTSGEAPNCHRMVILFACYQSPLSTTWNFSKDCIRIPSAMPLAIESLHFLTLSSRTGRDGLIKYVLASTISRVGSYVSKFVRLHHGAAKKGTTDAYQADLEAKRHLVQQLRELGFTKKGLPEWAGGLFTLEDFGAWLRRRRRIEKRVFWTAEQLAQQKRAVNRIHSRDKRTRRLQEFEVLKAQVEELEYRNQQARITHEILERLLQEAISIVDSCLTTPETRDPLPLVSAGWTFEPFHEPGVSAESLPFDCELPPSLEPDPIAPHCIPSASARSFVPSWTDVIRTHLEEPIAGSDVPALDASFSLQWYGDEPNEAQQQHNTGFGTRNFPSHLIHWAHS